MLFATPFELGPPPSARVRGLETITGKAQDSAYRPADYRFQVVNYCGQGLLRYLLYTARDSSEYATLGLFRERQV